MSCRVDISISPNAFPFLVPFHFLPPSLLTHFLISFFLAPPLSPPAAPGTGGIQQAAGSYDKAAVSTQLPGRLSAWPRWSWASWAAAMETLPQPTSTPPGRRHSTTPPQGWAGQPDFPCTHPHMHAHIYTCTLQTHICTHVRHTHTHTHTHTRTHAHAHEHARARTHMHARTHARTHTHTHTHSHCTAIAPVSYPCLHAQAVRDLDQHHVECHVNIACINTMSNLLCSPCTLINPTTSLPIGGPHGA